MTPPCYQWPREAGGGGGGATQYQPQPRTFRNAVYQNQIDVPTFHISGSFISNTSDPIVTVLLPVDTYQSEPFPMICIENLILKVILEWTVIAEGFK